MNIVTEIVNKNLASSPFGTKIGDLQKHHLGYMIKSDNTTIFTHYETAAYYAAGRPVVPTTWMMTHGYVRIGVLSQRRIDHAVDEIRKETKRVNFSQN